MIEFIALSILLTFPGWSVVLYAAWPSIVGWYRARKLAVLDAILDGRLRRWLEGERIKLDPWGTWLHSDLLDATQDTGIHESNETRKMGVSMDEANLLASPIPGSRQACDHHSTFGYDWAEWCDSCKPEKHILILDIDHKARWVPSSTPGKGHLYVNVPMTWTQAQTAVLGMVEAGVVHRNYMKHSFNRGYTNVRPPWVRKPKNLPNRFSSDHFEEEDPINE